jgi:alpha-D-ribose 1-methylphosphonate 5-triphosphate synthase subunit PhnL
MQPVLELLNVSKSFMMHLQGGIELPVLSGVSFKVHPGECIVVTGASGAGKSSILKMIAGSYRCGGGNIFIYERGEATDIAGAEPRRILGLRKTTIGYVSQFLRAIPRVPAIDVVAEPLIFAGSNKEKARERAATLLGRLNVSPQLWLLPPATFSGGEQQRVNVARGFAPDYSLLLLDEPTASLDAANRRAVVDLIKEKKLAGTGIVAVVHDSEIRDAIADTVIHIGSFAAKA